MLKNLNAKVDTTELEAAYGLPTQAQLVEKIDSLIDVFLAKQAELDKRARRDTARPPKRHLRVIKPR